jgi:hypothetical protein
VQRFLSLPIDDALLDELEQGPTAPSTLQAPAGTVHNQYNYVFYGTTTFKGLNSS